MKFRQLIRTDVFPIKSLSKKMNRQKNHLIFNESLFGQQYCNFNRGKEN